MCRRVKEVERWRIRISKEIKVYITRGRYCKVYKIPPNNMAWSRRKNAKLTRARTNCFATMEGRRKIGRQCKRW
jgi:hypothetical protein